MIRLEQGDCLEILPQLESGSVDCIITDLPYNLVEYDRNKKPIDLEKLWSEFKRILKPNAAVALFASSKFTIKLAASNFEQYKYKWVWLKNTVANFIHAKNKPLSKYEEILIFSGGVVSHGNKSPSRMRYNPQGLKPCYSPKSVKRKSAATFAISPKEYTQRQTNYPTDVLEFTTVPNSRRSHPNEKPVALLEYLIKTYSNEGEVILDATMGSGSCGVAAVNTNRSFIGIEKDEKYFEIASKRIKEAEEVRDGILFVR